MHGWLPGSGPWVINVSSDVPGPTSVSVPYPSYPPMSPLTDVHELSTTFPDRIPTLPASCFDSYCSFHLPCPPSCSLHHQILPDEAFHHHLLIGEETRMN